MRTAADHKPPAVACIGMARGVGLAVNEPIRGCPGLSRAVQGRSGLSGAKSAATVLHDSVSVTSGGFFGTRTGSV